MPLIYANVDLEYEKRTELRKEDVKYLKEWLRKQPHLPEMTELEVIIILAGCDFSVEMTKTTIDNHFSLRGLIPEVFGQRDFDTWKKTMDVVTMVPFPKLTPSGEQIFYCKINDPDPSKYVFVDAFMYADMVAKMTILQTGTVNGIVGVLDMDKFSLTHIAKVPLVVLRKLIVFLQEALPLKLKGIHLINGGTRTEKLMAIIRTFTKKGLIEMIHIHSDYQKTLGRHVPIECLPKDLGGPLESVHDMQEKVKEMVLGNMDFIREEEIKKVADESKRPHALPKFDGMFGIEGTFKKLELD